MSRGRGIAGVAVALSLLVAAACSGGRDEGVAAETAASSPGRAAGGAGAGAPTSHGPEPADASTPPGATPRATSPGAPPSAPTPSAVPAPPSTGPGPAAPTPANGPGVEGPAGDAFWVPPDPLPAGQPGDVIWTRHLPAPVAGSEAWLVLYRSTTAQGDPVAVSGVVLVPPGEPAPGGRPVVTLAHGTTGMADQCAPSRRIAAGGSTELSLVGPAAAAQGWLVVATDYQGLGTPGVHPYLVGHSEARNVLDLVRAAERMPATGATTTSPVVVIGHSQGGGASAFAAELAPTYAPDLDVRAAVAGAPATELDAVDDASIAGGPTFGFVMMIVAGFEAGYPRLPIDAVLMPAGQELLPRVEQGCVSDVLRDFADDDPAALLVDGANPEWAAALEENTAGRQGTPVPVYVFHGDADMIVPPAWSADYQARACAAGTNVTRTVYPGLDHVTVLLSALPAAFDWLSARVAGVPAPPGCP